MCKTFVFQSRNGLIWTEYTDTDAVDSAQLSIPQRSDLNSHQPDNAGRPKLLSIPQRSDLNSFYYPLIWDALKLSIPQRSDLNTVNEIGMQSTDHSFNPATVWFERRSSGQKHTYRKTFNPATVWFEREPPTTESFQASRLSIPQRSDLNLTAAQIKCGRITTFNPATVWFERVTSLDALMLSRTFNPATVWFELNGSDWMTPVRNHFQSRNGLIWTLSSRWLV